MCGITGAVPAVAPELLRTMTQQLAHRGPDGEGFFESPQACLGHRRLAVIDLVTGSQPMTTADGRYTLIFNGEIYNFADVRTELETLGTRFRTRSDTEVLLQAYARWGRAALDRLRGMFAFAIWDAHCQRLFLARDRIGVKPLYYCQLGTQLLFGSEIKALLAHPQIPRRLNRAALDDYLTYLYVPAPQTIFEGISELPPAHWLAWEAGHIETGRYWDAVPPPATSVRGAGEEDLVGKLRERLADAVRLRLISDVPLGAFLSGGIDSSTIVALMAGASSGAVRSFSLGFRAGEEHYTELEFARRVSGRYATQHCELEIRPDCADLLPKIVGHFDEPFGNPTALLLYQLSELTRRHVTVALAGDAGDELFLGYPRHMGVRLRRWLDAVPQPLRAALAGASNLIPESHNGFHTRRRVREFLSTAHRPWQQAYADWVSYFTPALRAALYTPDSRALVADYDSRAVLDRWFACAAEAHPLDQVSYVDIHTFLPFNLLEYGDRMSMAHGLELRLPFTDHQLVEFAMQVPPSLKLRGRRSKHLLREAAAPLLPREILERGKLGLNPPLARWLRHELAPLLQEHLSPAAVRSRGLFRSETIEQLKAEFHAGHRDYSLHLWSLLVLEEWCQQYLD